MRQVRRVQVLSDHRLRLEFDNGAVGDVDLATYVPFDGVFAPFRDPTFFQCVRVDREAGTICWPNGVDLDPDVLYSSATSSSFEAVLPPQPTTTSEEPTPGTDHVVPEISRFFGIIIRMCFRDHVPPHFHVEYDDQQASVIIESLSILEGSVSRRTLRLVVEWGELHRGELLANWERARHREPLRLIEPLE
jgi:hypothetical protein